VRYGKLIEPFNQIVHRSATTPDERERRTRRGEFAGYVGVIAVAVSSIESIQVLLVEGAGQSLQLCLIGVDDSRRCIRTQHFERSLLYSASERIELGLVCVLYRGSEGFAAGKTRQSRSRLAHFPFGNGVPYRSSRDVMHCSVPTGKSRHMFGRTS
jgi:hypothetical protein